jgi:hypothetical protein
MVVSALAVKGTSCHCVISLRSSLDCKATAHSWAVIRGCRQRGQPVRVAGHH